DSRERQLFLGIVAQLTKAKRGIGKIERAVGLVDQIIRTVEALAFVAVGEHGALAVFFYAHDVAIAVRAVGDAALLIQRDAVGTKKSDHGVAIIQLVARIAGIIAREAAFGQEHGYLFVLRIPFVDHIGWNI